MRYKYIDIPYNKDELKKGFNAIKNNGVDMKNTMISWNTGILNIPEVQRIFDVFELFDKEELNCAFIAISGRTIPYTNLGNNGLIFFPIEGIVRTNYYSYPPSYIDGRPVLDPVDVIRDPKLKEDVYNTISERVLIDRPMAVNGQMIHSYEPSVPGGALTFAIKIPTKIPFETLLEVINSIENA